MAQQLTAAIRSFVDNAAKESFKEEHEEGQWYHYSYLQEAPTKHDRENTVNQKCTI